MSLFHVIGFGWNLVLTLCYWFVSLVFSMNGEVMTTKSLLGDGEQIMMKLLEVIAEVSSKIYYCYPGTRKVGNKWWRKLLIAWLLFWIIVSFSVFWYMNNQAFEKRKETLTSMCDERARMLQDQFNVSMNHVQAMSILISTFHHSRNPSAIDQCTFARYTERTAFERPLTSGVAYAVRVLHSERKEFEKQHGWSIKRMDTLEQTPVHKDNEYDRDGLEPSPVQEDRENVLRARESGKGVLTAPFKLLKTNRLGVIKTFAVYKTDLPSNATPNERIQATDGYLGGVLDIESLVEKLLQQLASKQTILVNVYDTTNISHPISMYVSNVSSDGVERVSSLNFGDPFRRHEMRCRFKQKPPWPWLAITTSTGILIIALLIGQIFHATINRIAKVERDYDEMMMLKKRAEDADVAKSQFLATVSHEIRTPMNGVLGMLHMLMDTNLDVTQQDYVSTAQASGKALVSLINEVLDQAKIESGKLELEAVCFDVRATLDEVLSLFSGKSQEKGVELAVYISDKVPNVLIGDPGRFRQIITNLVGNSIKFTEKGHIFVTVHLVEEVIESDEEIKIESLLKSTLSGLPVADKRQSWRSFVCFNQEGSTSFPSSSLDQINLMVSVEDTGVGIPLDAQSRIFTPFMQVGPSIARIHGGTGIGLSISKCLVQLMKGEIGFVSLPKIGSTFTFTAIFTNVCNNWNEKKSQQISNQSNSVSLDFHGMRALIVDPRTVRARVAQYYMKRLGVHTEVVSDLNHGLSYLRTDNGITNMILIEQEVWDTDLGKSSPFVKNLRKINASVSPKLFILANSINSSGAGVSANGFPTPFVIMKPLRASMLAASLQRAMGVGNKGNSTNGELSGLSLSKLLQGRKILIVDDNNVNLRVAAAALKKYGADVVCTDSGKKALTFLQPPHQFDACFMDIQMPEMDGFEATKRIREMESNINSCIQFGQLGPEAYGNVSSWKVPILAMTADVIQATNEECQKCGMDGYVSKPFEAEQLYQEVSRFFHIKPNQNT
ncbi:histidine kinase 3 isoform X1 [Capsicum annuum]|uniref:histidine kinase 3 isoform X1 n=1 Tax=Capsicum annuum TaxID=4072 RepID=UPI001FB07F8A|nr:histidine kinase 3 isoform X1 [Capsicum annuum]